MSFFKDLYGFLKTRKKFWLLPMMIVLLLFGALIVLGEGSALAPFIYTVF
jgi:competence protein ComGC